MNIFRKSFWGKKEKDITDKVNALSGIDSSSSDPLDTVNRKYQQKWGESESKEITLKKVTDFACVIPKIDDPEGMVFVGDSKVIYQAAVEDSYGTFASMAKVNMSAYSVPEKIAAWYISQGFIGYQMCALLAQHWLVDKACSQSIEDAVRNGWTYKPDSGKSLTDEQKAQIDDIDIKMHLKDNLIELGRFTNIFGIRVMIFVVDSDDPQYYEKPFNIDGVRVGTYRGMSQIDPYWMTPMLEKESMSNPAAIGFYEPDFWVINGNKYHKSHLVITRGPQPADILKPTYIFGGVPLTQRIYERVYAAERTANEAPLLAMNKRTTAIHTDLEKVAANEAGFLQRLMVWVKYRDNHAVKVLGEEEVIEQMDTSLADFDNVIMNQYQLVASIARTPATKLLGTSPKGFNATGEFETVSYHEELESIQRRWFHAVVDRHYLILCKSMGLDLGLNVTWNPVDSMTSKQRAEINNQKVTDIVNLTTVGVISPDEGRDNLINDKDSGWNNLGKDTANEHPGMTPENIAELEKSGAQMVRAGAAQTEANNPEQSKQSTPAVPAPRNPAVDTEPQQQTSRQELLLENLLSKMRLMENIFTQEGVDIPSGMINRMTGRTPGVTGIQPSVSGIGSIVPALPEGKLPKMKIGGMMISIENPRNSLRTGNSVNGVWQVKMPHHYGYINGTLGADGDEIDCFVGPNLASGKVFVINQKDVNSDEFDEHKVMFGFNDAKEAQEAYEQSFEPGWGGFDGIVEMSLGALKSWAFSDQSKDQEAIGLVEGQ